MSKENTTLTNFSIQRLINEAVRRDSEFQPTSWNISKLGSCLRGVYFERLGVKPTKEFDDRTFRVFSVGKILENWVVDLVAGSGKVKVETQGRVENKEYDVSGYWDLLIEIEGRKILYEIKSKHSRAFWHMDRNGEGANYQHKLQLWTYLWLTGIEEGRILYISKDDLAILEYPVRRSNKKLEKEVMRELTLLNEAWKKKDPTLLPLPESKSWQARYCRWHSYCKEAEKYAGQNLGSNQKKLS